jgi:cytochrome c peroxidase
MNGGAAALVLLALAAGAGATEVPAPPEALRTVDPGELGYTYAAGAFAAEYTPPPPGSYALPVIDDVGDHPLLDADGSPTTLFAAKGDRVAVVAFVYTTCVEAAGCPLSMAVARRLDRALAAEPALAERVVLLTVSFDPERDTPTRMAAVQALHKPESRWRFLTARDESALAPLLADFGQPVARLRYADGRWTGLFRHVLKVFLVDGTNRVRNVYSAGFLHPALVLNDIRTVLDAPAADDGRFAGPVDPAPAGLR